MKRLLCALIALSMLFAAALAEESVFTLRFEDGFSLQLPEGWVSYPVTAEDRSAGVQKPGDFCLLYYRQQHQHHRLPVHRRHDPGQLWR